MKCEHDLAEMDLAVADGFCPLCLLDRIKELEQQLVDKQQALEYTNETLSACQNEIRGMAEEIQRLQQQVKERGEMLKEMFVQGYGHGHNDTVESCYCDASEYYDELFNEDGTAK